MVQRIQVRGIMPDSRMYLDIATNGSTKWLPTNSATLLNIKKADDALAPLHSIGAKHISIEFDEENSTAKVFFGGMSLDQLKRIIADNEHFEVL